jgi:uncharacterized membrane protein YqjE
MDHESSHDPSLRSLIGGILTDVRTLIREEVELATVELSNQANRARSAAVGFGAAAAGLSGAALFVLIAVALGISDVLEWPVWAGFLCVGVVLGLAGAIALSSARRQMRTVNAVPQETVSTIKENSAWIATRLSSAQR